ERRIAQPDKLCAKHLSLGALQEGRKTVVRAREISDVHAPRRDGLDVFGAAARGDDMDVKAGFGEFAAILAEGRLRRIPKAEEGGRDLDLFRRLRMNRRSTGRGGGKGHQERIA